MEQIRPAGPADAENLLQLERAAGVAALSDLFGGQEFPSAEVHERWTDELSSDTVRVLVAENGGQLVGYASFTADSLLHFGVSPERFGTGLADRLHAAFAAAADASAAASESRPLTLWVLEGNTRARRFYERHGWRPSGESRLCEWVPFPREVGYSLVAAP